LTLRDDGVLLRDWRDSDAPVLASQFGDPDVERFSKLPDSYSEEWALDQIASLRTKRASGRLLALAVALGDDLPAVGNVNLVFRFPAGSPQAALGYWISPEARGGQLAARAGRMLTDWGFRTLGLTRVELLIDPSNIASHRVAARLGAYASGHGTYEASDGQKVEMVRYDLLPNPRHAA
jgi:RimJ/RimL family protein N-acetyltransferase